MEKRVARLDAKMKEIQERVYSTPTSPISSSTTLSEQNLEEESIEIVEVEEEVSQRSCLSGATGLQDIPEDSFPHPLTSENWVQPLPLIPAVSAGISVTPLKPVIRVPSSLGL